MSMLGLGLSTFESRMTGLYIVCLHQGWPQKHIATASRECSKLGMAEHDHTMKGIRGNSKVQFSSVLSDNQYSLLLYGPDKMYRTAAAS